MNEPSQSISDTAVDYDVAGTRVVCNPRGYPGEETGFNLELVLTLPTWGRVA